MRANRLAKTTVQAGPRHLVRLLADHVVLEGEGDRLVRGLDRSLDFAGFRGLDGERAHLVAGLLCAQVPGTIPGDWIIGLVLGV